ncbi:hypothetical protein E2C06_14960 [Dankookia rubra]|uniref:DUF3106 domain-containing protein n=1 Tax=Dankookia rubra TaxID=1442381 RepID=A0A4R5QGW4_9PROT|nr:hypothetical protein [Dankookia rubra]TDH61831.1 hypothetical protein E2C06_14960 [Dankookia rubra]
MLRYDGMGCTPASTGRSFLALLCLLSLAGCQAMNQVTALDRFFEPERFGAKPAPARAARPPSPAQPAPAPARVPEPAPTVVAMEPLPDPAPVSAAQRPPAPAPVAPADPEAALRQTVRQHPWLTRFWSELRPTEQARIARQLPAAEDLPGTWDSMGLADRARLVSPASEERRWAGGP